MTSGDMEFINSATSTDASHSSHNNNNQSGGGGKAPDHQQQDFSNMPEVFEFQFMPSDLEAVLSEILMDTKVSDVFDAISQHIGDHIEPLGWKAVWQPTLSAVRKRGYPSGASFRVNVVNVFYQTMEASVTVSELLFPQVQALTEEQKTAMLPLFLGQRQHQQKPVTVPLRELYVISESPEDAQYHDTAFLIELVRFFYRHVWRPWDNLEEEGDGSKTGANFVATRLIPRLKMFWEMKNGIISRGFIRRVEAILAEGADLREKLDAFTERLESPAIERRRREGDVMEGEEEELGEEQVVAEDTSESESPSEMEARTFVCLKMKLQELEREMAIIEDALTRSLYHMLLPHKAEIFELEAEEEERKAEASSKQIHLVVKKFTLNTLSTVTAKLIKGLGMDNSQCNLPMKLHRSLHQAITAASSGDTIFLTKGIYSEPLPWLEKDLEIVAIDNEVTVLSNVDSGDVLLYVEVPGGGTVKLANLTLRATHRLNHLIVAKQGNLVLKSCKLDCGSGLTTGKVVLVAKEASLKRDQQTEVVGGGGEF